MGRGRSGSGVDIRENSIRVTFTYQGKQRRETLYMDGAPMSPTPPNIKYATRLAAEIREKVKNGTFKYAAYFPKSSIAQTEAPLTLGDFLDTWYSQLDLKGSTLKTYLRMKNNFWKPKLGDKPLTDIRHSDITKALKTGGWKSGKTRNNYLAMINGVFALAVADDRIGKNPCVNIEAATWQRKKPDPFSFEEAEKILAHLREKYPEQVVNYYEFQFFSGLRTSEAIGLEWSEIDFNNKTVLIKQGFVIDEMVEDTKTSRERTVRLNSRAMAALTRQKAWTILHEDGRVFKDPVTGKPWAYEQSARKRYWGPTLKLLGIRYRRPYNTRHTYATVGLMAGVNPAFMAKQLGHGVDVFYRVYADWIDDKQSVSEMDKIEQQIGQNIPSLSHEKKKAT